MKKMTLVLAGAVFLLAMPSVRAHAEGCSQAREFGGDHDDCKPQRVVKVSETNSFLLFATGLTALGGLALVTRKKLAHSKQ